MTSQASNRRIAIGAQILQQSKFHFVGIGGIGMCGLAELLHKMGAQVSGSDLASNANTKRLQDMGIKIFQGHQAGNVGEVDVVVYSSAVKVDNPELIAASAQKIPLIPRAEALAEIMRLHRGVAVAGSHGKTTTTSMAAAIFLEAKANPTIVVGGRLNLIQSTALLGTGDWLVAEADESDGSFNRLSPEIAVVTNIDSDHLDHFKSFANLQAAFHAFALRVPFYGSVIVCGDDIVVQKVFAEFPKRVVRYGFGPDNEVQIRGERGHYELVDKRGKAPHSLGFFDVQVPGRHNALNATAAMLAGLAAGFEFAVCAQGLARFEGVDRRFDLKGESKGVLIYDDYGHHPTEVRATLQAFKEKYPDRTLRVLFQPHRYSRTELCWTEFQDCFDLADEVWLTDIYAAGEAPLPGVDGKTLTRSLSHKKASFLAKPTAQQPSLAQVLSPYLQSGDIFLTLGAGDVWKVGQELLDG